MRFFGDSLFTLSLQPSTSADREQIDSSPAPFVRSCTVSAGLPDICQRFNDRRQAGRRRCTLVKMMECSGKNALKSVRSPVTMLSCLSMPWICHLSAPLAGASAERWPVENRKSSDLWVWWRGLLYSGPGRVAPYKYHSDWLIGSHVKNPEQC